jgi:dipeptidyl aminopeptidase/acylaminoacyl peptidase
MTAQIDDLILSLPEVISWRNQEGLELEGVLLKPRDFDPKRTYPLLCVVHGGPSELVQPRLDRGRYYPIEIWAARGAFVLRVNYRGSSGYGRKFRELDYRSFGIGDGADVLSGIDFSSASKLAMASLTCLGR